MKFLITIKHWQLFLLLTIYGFWPFESPIFNTIKYLGIAFFALWAFAIGYYGQRKLELLKLKPNNVKGIICCTILILITLITAKFYDQLPFNIHLFLDQVLPIIIFIAIIAGFYLFFFAAKTLAKIEFQNDVISDDYFTNFFLLAIPIVGIWILQPKVNRLIKL
jgi:hypothetical protein